MARKREIKKRAWLEGGLHSERREDFKELREDKQEQPP